MALPIFQRTVVNDAGDIIPSAQVEVRLESSGALASLFSDRAGVTPLANPFTTGAGGLAEFYASPNEYKVTATSAGDSIVWRYVVLEGTAALSDVTTSATDTTAGRLLKVGDFGIAGNVPIINNVDVNDYITPFSKKVFGSGCSNRPNENVYLVEVHGSHDTNRVTQVAYSQELTAIESFNSIYFRRTVDGGTNWSDWRELFHTGNILGTVSQTAGVPTGAIIESGSNGNGSYVKYADGTLICTARNVQSIAGAETFGFPTAFMDSSASVVASNSSSTSGSDITIKFSSIGTASYVSVLTVNGTLTAVVDYRLIAIGRWW